MQEYLTHIILCVVDRDHTSLAVIGIVLVEAVGLEILFEGIGLKILISYDLSA